MRILSRKKLEFRTGEGSTITVEPLVFTDVPESAKNDPMFGWALADKTIEVIETLAQQKKLENEPEIPTGTDLTGGGSTGADLTGEGSTGADSEEDEPKPSKKEKK